MSGIAEVMHQLGYKVQGSDVAEGYVVEGLRKAGIPVMIGHSADNLGEAAVVVCSTAIKDGNPEIEAAAERRLPRVRRAEMLAELMRMQKTIAVAGTHGKTTTTSMIAAMLDAGGLDPTVINGGIINRYGSNARLGKSDWMVVEADESDGSFLRLDGTIAVVTNVDPEHLEHYGSFERDQGRVRRVHRERAVLRARGDVRRSSRSAEFAEPRSATGGWSPTASRRWPTCAPTMSWPNAAAPGSTPSSSSATDRAARSSGSACRCRAATMSRMRWPRSPSRSSSASTTTSIVKGFEKFEGVKRRFTRVGEVGGAVVIDDYAHHPVEIRAVLSAARESAQATDGSDDAAGRVIAVVQPHRYTRLHALMDDFQNAFNDADIVLVAPVYAAGEEPIEGVDSAALAEGLRAHGHRMVKAVADPKELAESLRDIAAEGDMIICMGAGDITKWAAGLADGIQKARASK